MPAGLAFAREAVGEQPGEQLVVLGEGDQAVAHVAGRRHAVLAAQPAGGAAVVGDRDDRRQLGERQSLGGAQQRRQAGAAAEGDEARAVRDPPWCNRTPACGATPMDALQVEPRCQR